MSGAATTEDIKNLQEQLDVLTDKVDSLNSAMATIITEQLRSARRRSPSPVRRQSLVRQRSPSPVRRRSPSPRSRSRSPAHKMYRRYSHRQSVHVNNLQALGCKSHQELCLTLKETFQHFGRVVDVYVAPNCVWGKISFRNTDDCDKCLKEYRGLIKCEPQHPPVRD